MVKSKLISARKTKGYTQEQMAEKIHMSQSQYQRRERGEIKISEEEWDRIAKTLDIPVEEVKEEDAQTIVNNYDNNSGSYFGSHNYFYNIPEFILKNMQEYIDLLKEENKQLKEQMKNRD